MAPSAGVAADHHVFQRGHFGEQPNVLERAGDAGARHFVYRGGLVGLAGQFEAAAVGRIEAGEHVEERGFASAVGTDQTIDLTSFDFNAHVAEGLQTAETFGNAGHFENGVTHDAWPFAHLALRDLPCSGAGHRPFGRSSMMMIMASAISS
jgi:hypothetical protein